MSMMTLTRCSSTPSADILVKAPGSITRTRPASGWSSPHPSRRTGVPACIYLHGIGGQHVHHDLQISGVSELEQGCASRHHAGALLQHPEHVSLNGCIHLPWLPRFL